MDTNTELARFNMIQQQIRPWGVLDERVLEVMSEIPRESFVPDAYRGLAYADIDIPIVAGGVMLAPKIVGRLLQSLNIQPGDTVLEIGTGSGYLAACLSRLGGRVISLEIDAAQASHARERLATLKYERIEVREADGLAGPVACGPFDAIVIAGSMPTEAALPMLQEKLVIGGSLFCILGEAPVMQAVRISRVSRGDYRRDSLFETSAPALRNAPQSAEFEL